MYASFTNLLFLTGKHRIYKIKAEFAKTGNILYIFATAAIRKLNTT
jgi:hypothetical protein